MIMQTISSAQPNFENTCSVLITYYPDEELIERVSTIRHQVSTFIIVDNSANYEITNKLKHICKTFDCHLIFNNSNLGIATALNIGFKYAMSLNESIEWILTLDQDTLCGPELVKSLFNAYDSCYFKNSVMIVGSNYEEKSTGKLLHYTKAIDNKWELVNSLPSSGSLINLTAFNHVGTFRDDFFIDYVDTEFCLRVSNLGFKIIICPQVNMIHPLGYYHHSKLFSFLTGKHLVTNYPAFRQYYWTRNGSKVIKNYFFKDLKWCIKEIYYLYFRRVITVILFESEKIKKLKYVTFGLYHALIGKYGKIDF